MTQLNNLFAEGVPRKTGRKIMGINRVKPRRFSKFLQFGRGRNPRQDPEMRFNWKQPENIPGFRHKVKLSTIFTWNIRQEFMLVIWNGSERDWVLCWLPSPVSLLPSPQLSPPPPPQLPPTYIYIYKNTIIHIYEEKTIIRSESLPISVMGKPQNRAVFPKWNYRKSCSRKTKKRAATLACLSNTKYINV